jgi:tetratricopeptide (TPR) repeat protein
MNQHLQRCATGCLVAALGLLSPIRAASPQSRPPSADPLAMPADFPPADQRIWSLQLKGLTAKRGAEALANAPDAPETIDILHRAGRLDDAINVLRRSVAGPPANLERALALVPALVSTASMNGIRPRQDTIREVVATVKPRLADLPREDAARVARALLTVDSHLTRRERGAWGQSLREFVQEWAGTQAALLTEVDVITADDLTPASVDALEAFAREHPGTAAAAKALYQRGFNFAHNASALRMESPGADPLKRFFLVTDIVTELETGRYPKCEWVDKAPELLFGFFSYKPTYGEGTVARMLAVYEGYAKTHFTLDDRGLEWGLGYVISRKMRELYAVNGDGVAGVERFLSELERSSSNAPAVRYTRASFYLQLAREQPIERASFIVKARAALEALQAEGSGLYSRKALATLATMEHGEREYAAAARHLTAYLQSYPASPWAWVAALRRGTAYESLGDWTSASKTYLEVAARYPSVPPAFALGHEYAAHTLEALGRFSDAVAERERALATWDDDFGPSYSLYLTRPPRPDEPFTIVKDETEVTKTSLYTRLAVMNRTLSAPGGELLERARWHFARGELDETITTVDPLLRAQAQSPIAAEARLLSHRARVARAIDRRDRQELERLEQESYDFWISAARMARAAMLWRDGAASDAEALMMKALSDWHAHHATTTSSVPATDLEKDVVGLRNLVFRPRGDGLFKDSHWELSSLAPAPTPFFIVRPELPVKLSTGELLQVSVRRPLPDFDNVLFMDAEQLAFFDLVLAKVGGTDRRQPGAIMEVPNQPVGGSQQILTLLKKFFPARPGHWGGWMVETFPTITHIEFTNAERTKAGVAVTIGYEGATIVLEKKGGVWTYVGMTNRWIT